MKKCLKNSSCYCISCEKLIIHKIIIKKNLYQADIARIYVDEIFRYNRTALIINELDQILDTVIIAKHIAFRCENLPNLINEKFVKEVAICLVATLTRNDNLCEKLKIHSLSKLMKYCTGASQI